MKISFFSSWICLLIPEQNKSLLKFLCWLQLTSHIHIHKVFCWIDTETVLYLFRFVSLSLSLFYSKYLKAIEWLMTTDTVQPYTYICFDLFANFFYFHFHCVFTVFVLNRSFLQFIIVQSLLFYCECWSIGIARRRRRRKWKKTQACYWRSAGACCMYIWVRALALIPILATFYSLSPNSSINIYMYTHMVVYYAVSP